MRKLFYFCLLFIIFFFVFSSYNYILNFIQYGNPVSCSEQFLLNQFTGGIKGYISNVIKYFFAFFDMSGMPEFININGLTEYWQSLVLKLFGTGEKAGTSLYFPGYFPFNNKMIMTQTALGAPGLLVFLPSCVYAVKKTAAPPLPLRERAGVRGVNAQNIPRRGNKYLLAVLALSIVFNILLFSRVMVFTNSNMRYILTFIVIASPVIAYSYPAGRRRFRKILLCLIMFIYLIGNTFYKPYSYFTSPAAAKNSIKTEEDLIFKYFILKKTHNISAAMMTDNSRMPAYNILKLNFYGINTGKVLAENIETFDLSQFDYIITNKNSINKVSASYIADFEEHMKYPEKFVSKCTYYDSRRREIYNINTPPASVECEIPFDYLKKHGFIEDKNYNGTKYIILKKREN